ncbi:hypothetical protein [Methylocystis parvus]|uniref:hypothetical protein n=1 Tax=Methylocystis parvus TaxID=134 RepID=UPI003C790C5C
MTVKTDIELALADLEAGKFSFRMVETIKNHVATLERDFATATSVQESAANMLRQQEYTIARLEGELRKVNARVHALVKANALTETAMREGKRCALLLRDFLVAASRYAVALIKKAFAWLSSIDYKAEFEKAKSYPLAQTAQARLANLDLQAEWKKFTSHPVTEKALRELQAALGKAQEYLPVAQKQAAALIEKATALIADLTKKAA